MIWAGGKPPEEGTRKRVKRRDNSRHRAQAFGDLNGDLQSCSYTSLGRFKSFEEGLTSMVASELLVCEGGRWGKLRCAVLQTSKQRQPG